MKRIHLTAASIAIAAVSSLTVGQPGNSQGFWQQFSSIKDVGARQADITKRINDAVAAGRLNPQQSSTYRGELRRIADLETSYKADGKLSIWETVRLSYQLDQLTKELETQLGDRTAASTDVGGRQALDPEVDVKQAQLERRIDQAVTSGRIDSREAEPLRQELNRIATMKANFSSSGRGLNAEEKLSIAVELEHLSARIDQYVPTAVSALPGIDAKQEEIARKILDAESTGLNSRTLHELALELDRIGRVENTYRADGNLTDAETLALARDLDNLSARVDQSVVAIAQPGPGPGPRRGPGPWTGRGPDSGPGLEPEPWTGRGPAARPGRGLRVLKAEVQKMILDGMTSGRLPREAGAELNRELDRIAGIESDFRSDGALSDSESATLATDLETLKARVEHALSPLPTVEGRRAEIVAKIDSSLASGRLSAQAASELRQELDRVSSLEATFKASEGRLDDQEISTLDRDYGLVLSHLDRSQAQVPVPPVVQAQGPVAPDTRGHWAEPYVATLSGRNIIGGFPDGTFRPNDDITRAQFAAIAVKALNVPPAEAGRNFTDVPERHWAAKAIAAVSNAGLVTGFPEGTFRPEDKITRAQALVILAKALPRGQADTKTLDSYSDAQAVPGWARRSVSSAANAHIIVNYPDPTQVRPNALATRAEVASLIYQTMVNKGSDLPALKIGVLDHSH